MHALVRMQCTDISPGHIRAPWRVLKGYGASARAWAQASQDSTRDLTAIRADLERIKADLETVKSQLAQVLRLVNQRPANLFTNHN